MTIGNVKELISFDKEIKELKDNQKKRISRVLRKEVTKQNGKQTLKQKTKEYFNRIGKVRKYALISRLKTLLKISSDTEAYNSKVIIHICTFKNRINCTIPIEEVISRMKEEHEDGTKNGIRKDQIIKEEIKDKKISRTKDVGKTIKAAKQSKVYDKEKYSSSSAEVVANVASMIMAAAGKGKVMDKYVEIAKIATSLLTGANKSEIVVSHKQIERMDNKN